MPSSAQAGSAKPAASPRMQPETARRRDRSPLEPFFRPRSVALIGATEQPGSVGRALLENLQGGGFGGRIVPINPKRRTCLGLTCWPTVEAAGVAFDLAVVAVPAAAVPSVLEQLGHAHVRAAIIISAGFREAGEEGLMLESRVLAEARRFGIRLLGPNCLGLIDPHSGLNASFAHPASPMPRPGGIALLSQSGALCTAMLDRAIAQRIGLSALVSVGGMVDIDWADLIDHFAADARTTSILIYAESVGDARRFMSAAREASATKPVIMLKPGRSDEAARAAATHTGALTGADAVLDAMLRQAGVLRVDRLSELFDMAAILASCPQPRGPRLAVVTNAGGPGVLATDAAIADGARLAALTPATIARLDGVMPAAWSHANPVDVLGDAGPDRYAAAVDAVLDDGGVDGLLVLLTPQAMSDPLGAAEALVRRAGGAGIPVLAAWMGGERVRQGRELLQKSGIPVFDQPEDAVRAFALLHRRAATRAHLRQTPDEVADDAEPMLQAAIIDEAWSNGRTLLDEEASKRLFAAAGIPVNRIEAASDPVAAVLAARRIGYPVAVKLLSSTLTHKAKVGGVRLGLDDDEEVRAAYAGIARSVEQAAGPGHMDGVTVQQMVPRAGVELLLGMETDPQVGPVIMLGAGGSLAEALRDRALALPPVTTSVARDLIGRTRIGAVLDGKHGVAVCDRRLVEQAIVRFARLVIANPRIRSCEINPLAVLPDRVVALDARVVLHQPGIAPGNLPRPAQRPWPSGWSRLIAMPGGGRALVRAIRAEDEPLMQDFHRALSAPTVRARYGGDLPLGERIAHDRLARICHADHDRELVLVAEIGEGQARGLAGVARLSRDRFGSEADLRLVVADAWQNRGLGRALAVRLVEIAREERITRLRTTLTEDQYALRRLLEKVGFAIHPVPDEDQLVAAMDLS